MRKENKIYCNSCGKRIVDTIGRDMEEYIHIEKIWGYPSAVCGRLMILMLQLKRGSFMG